MHAPPCLARPRNAPACSVQPYADQMLEKISDLCETCLLQHVSPLEVGKEQPPQDSGPGSGRRLSVCASCAASDLPAGSNLFY